MTDAVSAIIPAYNAGAYLAQAIASVRRQSVAVQEIIVVDDGSSDNTAQIALAEGAVLIQQPNSGAAAARNTGLQASSGEFIAFLDADDRWAEDKLEKQLAAFRQAPDTALVLGLTQPFRGDKEKLCDSMLILLLGAALVKREVFEHTGPLDTALGMGEDTDWFMHVLELALPSITLPDTVLYYRRHAGNMTSDREAANRFLVRALKRSLDRRRQAGGNISALTTPDIPDGAATEKFSQWLKQRDQQQ